MWNRYRQTAYGLMPMVEHAAVHSLLRDNDFEQLSAVPAIPLGGRGRLPVVLAAADGPRSWQLRAHGLDFDLLLPPMARQGLRRVYSLGWGLAEGGSATVLLVQAVGDESALVRLRSVLAGGLDPFARAYSDGLGQDDLGGLAAGACLRAAATLAGWPGA